MRTAGDALALRHFQLVVDPAVARIERPAIGIVRGDEYIIRTRNILEILEPPGVSLKDGHGAEEFITPMLCQAMSVQRISQVMFTSIDRVCSPAATGTGDGMASAAMAFARIGIGGW